MNAPPRTPRLPDWQPRLFAYLAEARALPFAYGTHDCALHAARAVQAMTGQDPAADLRGRYRTLRGGLRHLRKAGHADHIAAAAAVFDEVPVLMAGIGDLAVVRDGEARALGVVQGASVAVLTERGMGLVDLTRAERAFRV